MHENTMTRSILTATYFRRITLTFILCAVFGYGSVSAQAPTRVKVTRELPVEAEVGEPLRVVLKVEVVGNNPDAGAIVVEKIPFKSRPASSSPQFSRFDKDTGELRYLLSENTAPLSTQEITYTVPTTQLSPGIYTFEGSLKMIGVAMVTSGDRKVKLVEAN